MSDLAFFAQRTTGWATSVGATSEKGNSKNERMSVSDLGEKIEWGADSEPRKNERVPSRIRIPDPHWLDLSAVTFWYGSGSITADPCLWLMDPDPAVFVIDLQDANKKLDFSVPKKTTVSGQTSFWYRYILVPWDICIPPWSWTYKEPEISVPLGTSLVQCSASLYL